METVYQKSGSRYFVQNKANYVIEENLPPKVFVLKYDNQAMRFFLEEGESFSIPQKLYGDVTKFSDRILNTFNSRSQTTGVLLTGEKGSGKTILAKKVCVDAMAAGCPVILVNDEYDDTEFVMFLQSIQQPCVLFFDEFEKVFSLSSNVRSQNALLTLLDGVFSSKKLILMTSNDSTKISPQMLNRPSRIFYMKKYTGLDENFVREYCADNLKYNHHLDELVTATSMYAEFNFDMLQGMVEEINRYDESPLELIDILNIKPQNCHNSAEYNLKFYKDGNLVDTGTDYRHYYINPMEIERYDFPLPSGDSDYTVSFSNKDLISFSGGQLIFSNSEGYTVEITRPKTVENQGLHKFVKPNSAPSPIQQAAFEFS